MKKLLSNMLCVLLGLLLLAGCGVIPRAVSALKRAVRGAAGAAATPRDPEPSLSNPGAAEDKELPAFFREVVFGNGAHAALKWTGPVSVSLSGDYDARDYDLVAGVLGMLNEYDGYPGAAVSSGEDADAAVQVRFVTAETLAEEEPGWSGNSCCFASYWYDGACSIYKGLVYLVPEKETSRADRDCDLAWGVFYTLGFAGDSSIYADSLFNPQYYGDALGGSFRGPSREDWQLVAMLYDRAVKPGMTYEQAMEALSEH